MLQTFAALFVVVPFIVVVLYLIHVVNAMDDGQNKK